MPSPALLSHETRPLGFWTMAWEMERPRPVPRAAALVVKKGKKTRWLAVAPADTRADHPRACGAKWSPLVRQALGQVLGARDVEN